MLGFSIVGSLIAPILEEGFLQQGCSEPAGAVGVVAWRGSKQLLPKKFGPATS